MIDFKKNGKKHHIIVNKLGNSLGVVISSANRHDSKLFSLSTIFLSIQCLVRLGLLIWQDASLLNPLQLLPILLLGLIYDLAVIIYWFIPLSLLALPLHSIYFLQKFARFSQFSIHKLLDFLYLALVLILITTWVWIAGSEFVFWNEFNNRFNFIAVDYLIYTSEVIQNIKESYNLTPIILGIIALSLLFYVLYLRLEKFYRKKMAVHAFLARPLSFKQKLALFLINISLAGVSYLFIDADFKEFSQNKYANQLAGNGHFEFGHAFFHNEIDYPQYYAMLPEEKAKALLKQQLGLNHLSNASNQNNNLPAQQYQVNANTAALLKPKTNIVLISVESLSAEFLQTFGQQKELTPNLDALAKQSWLFTNMYATGLRTVRGLEAISLSIPPTPGFSVVKRNQSEGLATIGAVLQQQGYHSTYIYGGYSRFDNMLAYFGSNGYQVVDRTDMDKYKLPIHYENVWGVADEDLFSLTLANLNEHTQAKPNQPFFAHIMTTSNHRPFTYPDGRIDIPSKTGRDGAVKYTDWAIGDFIKRAKQSAWFNNTVFVIVADHCASGRGKTDLAIENFKIPLMIYAPSQLKPQVFNQIRSQIDIAPTLLDMLGIAYTSKFFGHSMLKNTTQPKALFGNYQTVGMYVEDKLVELRPKQHWRLLNAKTYAIISQGRLIDGATDSLPIEVQQTIAYYQLASKAYREKQLQLDN